jgi:hypothetical protein
MVEIVRELEEADLQRLEEDRGVKSPTLRKLTDMHHSIAWMVAQGEAGYAISMTTGYSESRISILKGDPAFQELVAHYRTEIDGIRRGAFIDITKKMNAGLADTIDRIHEKVLDEDVHIRDLVDVGKFLADRSGFGPASKTTTTNLNVEMLADTLAAGRQRAIELSAAVPAAQAGRDVVPTPSLPAGDRRDE